MKQNLLRKFWLRVCMLVAVILCGAGSAWGQTITTYTFSSKSWAASPDNWSGTAEGNQFNTTNSPKGVQVTTGKGSGAIVTSPKSFSNVTKVVVTYSSSSKGVGSIEVKVGTTSLGSKTISKSQTEASLEYSASNLTGLVSFIPTVTTNSLGINSIAITEAASGSTAEATTTTIDASGITNTDVYTSTAAGSLAATVKAGENAVTGATVTWSGDNDNVATINASTGAVTLVAAGSVTFTASYAGVSGQYESSSAIYEMTVTSSDPAEILDYTSLGLENAAELGIQNAENFSATAEQGTNTNNSPKYYTSDNTARFYAGNTLTISSNTNKKIAKIEFNVNVDATVNTGSLSNNMWIGSATTVVFTMPKVSIKTIKVTFENENLNDPELSFPTTAFEVEAGATFTAPTLTNPHSLQVTYSSSNADIATVNETTGAVTIGNTPGTVTITATFEGNDVYSFGSASYTITVSTVLSNIAALTALEEADDYQVHLTNALVTYIHGNNAYLEDASGAVLLYDCADDLAVGDKINGTADVTYTVYHNLPEVTAINLHEGYTKTSGNTVTPTEITIAELNENFTSYISRYVKIVEATVTSAFDNRSAEITQGEASIDLRDQNSTATLTATVDDIVTVTAHPAIYNTTKQIAVYEQSQIVVKPIEKINPTIVVEDASIAFGSSYTIDTDLIEGGDVTATSGTTAVATVNGLVITPIAVGSTVITVTTAENNRYNAGSETFTLTVTAPEGQTTAPTASEGEVFFHESFNQCEGAGGNDDLWSGSIANNDIVYDITGWETDNGKGANKCAKFGTGSLGGYLLTPTLGRAGDFTLTFKAAAWNGSKEGTTLSLSTDDTPGTLNLSEVTLVKGQWSDYTVSITGATAETKIMFYTDAGNHRVFLDEVKIEAPATEVEDITVSLNTKGYATYCSQYPLDFTNATDYTAWAVTSVSSEGAVTFSQITGAVMGGVGVLLKGAEGATVNLSSTNSTHVPTNQLIGTLAPTYIDEVGSVFGLSGDKFVKNNAVGAVKANKAYLPASVLGFMPIVGPDGPEGIKMLTFVFEGADGVKSVERISANEAVEIFNIAGQRVSTMQRGVNIVNGKKVLVK